MCGCVNNKRGKFFNCMYNKVSGNEFESKIRNNNVAVFGCPEIGERQAMYV